MSTAVDSETRLPWWTLGASVVLTIVPLTVFLVGDSMTREIVVAVGALAVAAYAAAVHPLSVFVASAVVLGFVPYLDVPGTRIPVILVLAVGLWVALAFLPDVRFRPGWCELWVFALAATALLSVVATGVSTTSLTELAAWLAATAVVVPVRFLPASARTTMARVFVVSTAAASVLGIVLVRIDPHGVLLGRFAFAGYDPTRRNVQQVGGTETLTTRLTGTFVEPNIAGLVLAAGVLLAVAYFRGPLRATLIVVIGAGLLLTLSRSAIATVVVAGILLALRAPGGRKVTTIIAGLFAGLGSLAIPQVRDRLLDSFGPSDTGTRMRDLALQEFPRAMDGQWVWGLGWAREEFRDPALGRAVNFVANAPLITVYRGGVVLGVLVVLVLVVLLVRSWFVARGTFEGALLCTAVIGFVLVACQLDFPIVLQAPATVLFSFLVGLSLAPHASAPPGTSHA